ncbi:MAG: hypothetical protein LUC43_04670 [Burkholderiales bacterium]|nr:hypothetical protein [Burkholderiales bacterium]
MNIDLCKKINKCHMGNRGAKDLLRCICWNADEEGICLDLSRRQILNETELSVSSFYEAKRYLVSKKWLTFARSSRSHKYVINTEKIEDVYRREALVEKREVTGNKVSPYVPNCNIGDLKAKAVLRSLCDHIDEKGKQICNPNFPTLAAETELAAEELPRILKYLIDREWIRQYGANGKEGYEINVEKIRSATCQGNFSPT